MGNSFARSESPPNAMESKFELWSPEKAKQALAQLLSLPKSSALGLSGESLREGIQNLSTLDRLWEMFQHFKLMVDLIHKVRQERVPGARVEQKILYPENRDHVDLRLAARRAMIFGSLNPSQQEDIKAQADGMLNQDSVHLLLKSFKDYVDLHCNPDVCLDALFNQFQPISDLYRRELELEAHEVVKSPEEISRRIETEISKLKHQKMVVRVYVASLGNRKSMGAFSIWTARLFTTYGANHTGLQIGPYFVHWTASGIIQVHPINSYSVCALLYPKADRECQVEIQPEFIKWLCNWNKTRTYSQFSCNCQHFVDEALKQLDLVPTWKNNENFLTDMAKLDFHSESKTLTLPDGKTETFSDWSDFKRYCEKVTELRGDGNTPTRRLKPDFLKVHYPSANDQLSNELEQEYLRVLKAIERGFCIQRNAHQAPIDSRLLIFPVSQDNVVPATNATEIVQLLNVTLVGAKTKAKTL